MWLGSSLAAEGAGQLAEGTGYEDLARLGTAIAAGGRPRFRRPGPRTRPTAEWGSRLDEADAKLAMVGEWNPLDFAKAGLERDIARAGHQKGMILDEMGKRTPEGFAALARDPVRIKPFSQSEQMAIRRAGGDSMAENTARWLERNSPPPKDFPDVLSGLISDVKNGATAGGSR